MQFFCNSLIKELEAVMNMQLESGYICDVLLDSTKGGAEEEKSSGHYISADAEGSLSSLSLKRITGLIVPCLTISLCQQHQTIYLTQQVMVLLRKVQQPYRRGQTNKIYSFCLSHVDDQNYQE